MLNQRKLWLSIFMTIILVMGFGSAAAFATSQETKDAKKADWMFHDIVEADFVKQYVKIPKPEGVMIIDSRPKRSRYDKGHIPTAVNIPDSKFDKMTDLLPKDKHMLLIFYCQGLKCKLSHNSAWKAEKLGYTNVKVFAKGLPGWLKVKGHYASVSVEYVKNLVDTNADMVIVDSRPKRTKYDKGHLPGAISIPDSQFDKLKDQLPAEKNKLLVFYCEGFKCKLSHKSAEKAIQLGYTNVKVFAAGYPAWEKAYVASAAPAVKAGAEEGSIDNASFEQIISNNPESIYLIDVRDPDEFSAGSFKTAINIPTDDLEEKIKTLKTDKPIIFICSTGARSGEAYYMVKDLRPEVKEVYYLEAELTINKDGSYKIEKPQ